MPVFSTSLRRILVSAVVAIHAASGLSCNGGMRSKDRMGGPPVWILDIRGPFTCGGTYKCERFDANDAVTHLKLDLTRSADGICRSVAQGVYFDEPCLRAIGGGRVVAVIRDVSHGTSLPANSLECVLTKDAAESPR
jgi:hypothetical protein